MRNHGFATTTAVTRPARPTPSWRRSAASAAAQPMAASSEPRFAPTVPATCSSRPTAGLVHRRAGSSGRRVAEVLDDRPPRADHRAPVEVRARPHEEERHERDRDERPCHQQEAAVGHLRFVDRRHRDGLGPRPHQRGAGLRRAVLREEAEPDRVAVGPLVVVDRGPVEEPAEVDPVGDGLGHEAERLAQELLAPAVVVGADAVLADEERRVGQVLGQPVQQQAEALAPRRVPHRADAGRRPGRRRCGPPGRSTSRCSTRTRSGRRPRGTRRARSAHGRARARIPSRTASTHTPYWTWSSRSRATSASGSGSAATTGDRLLIDATGLPVSRRRIAASKVARWIASSASANRSAVGHARREHARAASRAARRPTAR